jgi:hypothetical protein
MALMLLLALAVEAPRNWQRLPADDSAWNKTSSSPWDAVVLWPRLDDAKPIKSFASPVVAPMLPPIEEDSYALEDFDFAMKEVSEHLPLRSRFTLEIMQDIRDAILDATSRLREVSESSGADAGYALPHRVQVTGPSDRLAMRSETDRHYQPHAEAAAASEDFADMLLESVRRSREAALASSRLALRTEPQTSVGEPAPESDAASAMSGRPLLRFRPVALIATLEAVPQDSPAAAWARESLGLVRQLADDAGTPEADAPRIVEQLQTLAVAARNEALQLEDHALQYRWLRAVQAVERRTVIWRLLFDFAWQSASLSEPMPTTHESSLLPILGATASRLTGVTNGEDWREYLLLDQIAVAASEGAGVDVKGRRKLAQEVLSRVTDKRLTAAQKQFIESEVLVKLREALQPWAMGPVDVETLAALIEHYEANPDLRYAAALAQLQQRLQWSPVAEYQQLAQHLDEHYRGANMRVALTGDLMNRMMPKPTATLSPVQDKIAGTKVRGRSRTTTQVQVRLLPNDEAWQFSLEASGAVYSRTRSETWPARVQNAAKMYYQTRKTVLIDQQGLRVAPAQAEARGRNELVGIDTNFDPVPVVSTLLRDAARRKHQESRPLALAQVKSKVARQARVRMDREANSKIEKLEKRFETNILTSIEDLALVAEPLEMYTTEDRAVMELRLANGSQLAANTLRPLAPSDSVASMQVHESVLNNAAAGLGLDGRRMTLLELFAFLSERFGDPDATPPEDLPVRAVVEFASHDAIHVRCAEDRLELVLNIRQVSQGRDKIQNFQVHAYFRPVVDGLDVRLVRDGTLQFNGRNLRTGPRVVLHGVFGKLLVKDQKMPLLKRDLGDDPRLEGLMVTQLVIDEGWIGLSVGPEFEGRTAWRTQAHTQR